ncbi:TPA: hypothetical protein HA338_10865 [Methanosarcina acetivorans]|uniref:Uncharacterized protein n=2 Tax=Methanosarcina acetivorans TaxID=2214 RepID=Q8TTJ3_METAC|nr:hypothetical protein [Methanosarcina acetivorans]AAM03885.1 predicted protein [Methanosarcina acetivorans C2A]HIH94497.1 hypothetical protein [Methanosarcina acetivorans]
MDLSKIRISDMREREIYHSGIFPYPSIRNGGAALFQEKSFLRDLTNKSEELTLETQLSFRKSEEYLTRFLSFNSTRSGVFN